MRLGILILSLCFSQFGFASASEPDLIILKESMAAEVNTVVRSFDQNAYAILSLKAKKDKPKLPATPFIFDDIVIKNPYGEIALTSVKITVVSLHKTIPDSVLEMVNEVVAPFGVKPSISLMQPPQSKWHPEVLMKAVLQPQNQILLAGMALTLVALILFFFVYSFGTGRVKRAITESAGKISQSLEQRSSQDQVRATAQEVDDEPVFESDENDRALLASLSKESISALFADCYWCDQDGYAAYLWANTTIPQRMSVIEELNFLKDYSLFISQKTPRNLGHHNAPYYLSPLPINKTDNDELKKIVESSPLAFKLLPKMRTQAIEIPIKERIKLESLDKSPGQSELELFSNVTDSEPRIIHMRTRIFVKTTEEEEELIEMQDLSIEQMEDIVSICWAMKLDKPDLEDVLRAFSAVDLAEVWVGPDVLLSHLKESTPERKMALIDSYMEKTKPNRNSPVYSELHRRIIEKYSEKSFNEESLGDGSSDQAA